MALSDNARLKLGIAAGDISVGEEVQTKLFDKTGANTISGTQTFSGAFVHTGTTFGALGATAVVVPTAYTQTYSTAARTVDNATVAAIATTGATNSSPFGYTGAAQADAIPVGINALAADVLSLKKVLTALIDDLQAYGFID